MAPVAIDIPLKFLPPELLVGPRSSCVATAFMAVPEATVDEHHRPVLREHKVGRAGQLAHMKSISKPSGEKKGAKRSFRPSVLSANARHHAAALRCSLDAHCLLVVFHLNVCGKQRLRASDKQSGRMKTVHEATFGSLTCC